MKAPDDTREQVLARAGYRRVAGVDEVGRGPWAGPVVAAAVVLDLGHAPAGLNDSKRLSPARRTILAHEIAETCAHGIGVADVAEIEEMNILRASQLAMRRALADLPGGADFALIDGRHLPPGLPCPAEPVIRGDARAVSIAAASIVAKVHRDAMMVALAQQHPGYGWENNMGYGTSLHRAGLHRLGITPHHRRTFRPIHQMLYQENLPTD